MVIKKTKQALTSKLTVGKADRNAINILKYRVKTKLNC